MHTDRCQRSRCRCRSLLVHRHSAQAPRDFRQTGHHQSRQIRSRSRQALSGRHCYSKTPTFPKFHPIARHPPARIARHLRCP
jgi:hypothetical protein